MAPRDAIQSLTDYDTNGSGRPYPPDSHGLHQYVITNHALKTEPLELN